jgi:hypothetical protein
MTQNKYSNIHVAGTIYKAWIGEKGPLVVYFTTAEMAWKYLKENFSLSASQAFGVEELTLYKLWEIER